jgi:hypothetical protein
MCQQRSASTLRSRLDAALRIALLAALGLLVQHALTAPAGAEPLAVPGSPGPEAHLQALRQAAPDLDPDVLDLALAAHAWALESGKVSSEVTPRANLLTVIDYSRPSTEPRLWVFDLERERLLFRELVAHGVGSGDNLATRFSNADGSRESSLGLFRTGDAYQGKNGYSLRLHGLEPGTNDQAFARTIVLHGAWYVSREHAERYGRLGRSWGCPAVPLAMAQPIIDALRGGSLPFVYSPEPEWVRAAAYAGDRAAGVPGARTAAK